MSMVTTTPLEHAALVKDEDGALNSFSNLRNFESGQRIAKALTSSNLVPEAFRNNIPNVLIAMELAARLDASVFAVMQNLDVIHGRPGFRATFLIATVNACKRFTPIKFRWEGKPGTDAWGCRAYAKERESGEECLGTLITIGIAKAEGWYSRNGSKWKTIPEQMLCYRAAAFWTRIYAPELSLGMQTSEEVIDTTGYAVVDAPHIARGDTQALEAALLAEPAPAAPTSDGELPLTDEERAAAIERGEA